jgi:hypothetical protein
MTFIIHTLSMAERVLFNICFFKFILGHVLQSIIYMFSPNSVFYNLKIQTVLLEFFQDIEER